MYTLWLYLYTVQPVCTQRKFSHMKILNEHLRAQMHAREQNPNGQAQAATPAIDGVLQCLEAWRDNYYQANYRFANVKLATEAEESTHAIAREPLL